jgi:hypothetical protein
MQGHAALVAAFAGAGAAFLGVFDTVPSGLAWMFGVLFGAVLAAPGGGRR